MVSFNSSAPTEQEMSAVASGGGAAAAAKTKRGSLKRTTTAMDLLGRAKRGKTAPNLMTLTSEEFLPKDTVAVAAAAHQMQSKESFFKSLPKSTFGFLSAVAFDQFLMLGYALVLITSGSNTSAYYFAACIVLFAFALVYFSLSAVRSENTVELLTAIAVGTGVTATIYYVRLGGDISNVQRESTTMGETAAALPEWVVTTVTLTCQGCVQLGLMFFGYRSYLDFGWRIFKLFGTDLRMRTVYETFLWLKAMLKLDFMLCCLCIAAGYYFFFMHLTPFEKVLMSLAIVANVLWVIACFLAVKAEWRRLATLLMAPSLLVPAYLVYKGYDLYNHEYIMQTDKYDTVWKSPVNATIFAAVITRCILIRQMWKARANFGKGLKGFSMHDEYELPEHLRAAMPETLAGGVKAMVKGATLLGTMELRTSVLGKSEAKQEEEKMERYMSAVKAALHTHADGADEDEAAEREKKAAEAAINAPMYKTKQNFFRNKKRFFQLSNDLTTLRWSWKEYLLLDEVVKVSEGQAPNAIELHAGDIFQRRVLTLRFGTADEASCWLLSMRALLRLTTLGDRDFTLYLLDLFKMADRQRIGAITAKNRRMALSFLNLELERATEEKLMTSLDMDDSGALDFREFVALVRRLSRMPLLTRLYQKYNGEERYMDRETFETLWKREQGELPPQTVLDAFNANQSAPGMISESGFHQILTSAANDAADPRLTGGVHHDMSRPLSDYFCDSSHNTYLTGDQLRSNSSCEMYARALLMGSRCVEIDCWDGPEKEPEVYHGYTLTSHLRIRDVLQTIAEHAFTASPYPLVLSIEMHCSLPQQQTLAAMLVEILGEALYVPDAKARSLKQLPSPEELRGRILIKGKTNDIAAEDEEAAAADKAEGQEDDEKYAGMGAEVNAEGAGAVADAGGEQTAMGVDASGHAPSEEPSRSQQAAKPKRLEEEEGSVAHRELKFHKDLCDITAIKGRSKLRPDKFSDPSGSYDPWQMSSFGEAKCFAYLKEHRLRWLRHNRCHLSRCFPKGTRVDSSNMQPHPFWDVGCAMVALNYQTFDLPMQINQGKFRDNGGCGWVLKPSHLRGEGRKRFGGAAEHPHKLTKLQVKLVGALHLIKPGQERMQREAWQLDTCPLLKQHELSAASVVNPQVTVEVYGGTFCAAGDVLDACANGDTWTSNTKQRNGLNPLWNEHVEVGVSHPELAVLRFAVTDKQSAVTGSTKVKEFCYATLPVAAIRSGYRSVPLRDKNGCLVAFSTLLVHVRQSHTHLPPSLRSEAAGARAKAAGGEKLVGVLEQPGNKKSTGKVRKGKGLGSTFGTKKSLEA